MSSANAEWWFYHLERGSVEAALGPLVEKCLQRSWRVLIVADPQRVKEIDSGLWTWRDDSFLPHGTAEDAPKDQPVLISAEVEPVNGADVLILLDGMAADGDAYQRVMVVFADADTASRGKARGQFKAARDAGSTVKYFQQTSSGGWAQKS